MASSHPKHHILENETEWYFHTSNFYIRRMRPNGISLPYQLQIGEMSPNGISLPYQLQIREMSPNGFSFTPKLPHRE